jgi:homoserine dehydrogenase
MKTHSLIFVGFGGVGRATAQVLLDKETSLAETYGLRFTVLSVITHSRGTLYHPDGLDLATLLDCTADGGDLHAYPNLPGLVREGSAEQLLKNLPADTAIELTPTNLSDGQPALDHCRWAIQSGKNVITANKGPLALAYPELRDLAQQHGVQLGFESTVMAGTPALRTAETLKGCTFSGVAGILNGTTNYILTQMEGGADFAEVLAEAQQLGYAETDPSGDVDGHDAAAKVVILGNVLLGGSLTLADVETLGIRHLTQADIETARAQGKRWKLIGRVLPSDSGLQASVAPEMLPVTDPLANVGGATNALTYHTDLLGPVTLVGAGAGGPETAAGILADLLTVAQG